MNRLELYHHGILGQKWGVRRYQYEDGSLTPAGKQRYGGISESNLDDASFYNYSSKQRKQDERLYGPEAVKRIEHRLVDGETLLSARHKEVVNKQTKTNVKRTAKKVAKATLAASLVVAPVAIAFVAKKKGLLKISPIAINAGQTFLSTFL